MGDDASAEIVLHQFAASHFNEKARWGLDWKGLPHSFAGTKPAPVRGLYRALFPLVRGRIARAHEVDDPAAVSRAFDRSRRALDFVARESEAGGGPLVGETFGLADLTCAALLAPLAELPHPDMARPRPIPPAIADFLEGWQEHPAIAWVRAQYERHRPASRARSGPAAEAQPGPSRALA